MNNERIENLKTWLELANHQVYSLLRYVSPSGQSRSISFYIIVDNKPMMIDGYISEILDYKIDDKHDGLKISGCGMDMGFHIVYSLSCALYCTKEYTHDSAYKLKNTWL